MDELNDMARVVRDKRFHYIRNYQPDKPYYQNLPYRRQMDLMNEILRLKQENKLSPVTKRWFETKAPEELYDVQKDPFELKNLAKDPAYKKTWTACGKPTLSGLFIPMTKVIFRRKI